MRYYYFDKIISRAHPLGATSYTVVFDDEDLVKLKFTAMDLALMHECEKSKLISDQLLALGCMARAIERERLIEQISEGGKAVVTA